MALSRTEQLIAEAVKNMLGTAAKTGDGDKQYLDQSHTFTYLHEEIEQAYSLATIKLVHHDAICSAFSKIHSYKYLNDPTFINSFRGELTARAVPANEIETAIEQVDKVMKKMLDGAEKDAGWNPDLVGIEKVSQPVAESKMMNIRESLNKQPKHTFWESVKRFDPLLVDLGYSYKTPQEFWGLYDDPGIKIVLGEDLEKLLSESLITEGK